MASLLPALLQKKDGSFVETATALAGFDYVFLYFSASWCGPCRRFTPSLNAFLTAHSSSKRVCAVLVPADRSEADALSYLGHMDAPGGAVAGMLPFEAPEVEALNAKFKVRGIPTLVLVDASGAAVSVDAVEALEADAEGARFPWRPANVWDILERAGSVRDKAGASTPVSELRKLGSGIALYFSAHWCPPCRGFTPELAAWYNARVVNPAGALAGKLDIVFVSSDRDEASFSEYLGEMPWKALPFERKDLKTELSRLFHVQGIPSLIFVDSAGNTITDDGRSKVSAAPDAFPWPPQPFDTLSEAVSYINDAAVAILFTDNLDDAATEVTVTEAFQNVAKEFFAGGKPHERIRFAVGAAGDDAIDRLRSFLGVTHMRDKDGPTSVRLTIVNIPGGKKHLWNAGKLAVPSEADMRAFINSFLAGEAPGSGLRE